MFGVTWIFIHVLSLLAVSTEHVPQPFTFHYLSCPQSRRCLRQFSCEPLLSSPNWPFVFRLQPFKGLLHKAARNSHFKFQTRSRRSLLKAFRGFPFHSEQNPKCPYPSSNRVPLTSPLSCSDVPRSLHSSHTHFFLSFRSHYHLRVIAFLISWWTLFWSLMHGCFFPLSHISAPMSSAQNGLPRSQSQAASPRHCLSQTLFHCFLHC